MAPKYDTQILIGIGVVALIAMGISESNKKKVSEGDEPMQDPPAEPQPVQPSDMQVADRGDHREVPQSDQTVLQNHDGKNEPQNGSPNPGD